MSSLNTARSIKGIPNLVEMDGQSVEVARKQSDGAWMFLIDNPFGLGWE